MPSSTLLQCLLVLSPAVASVTASFSGFVQSRSQAGCNSTANNLLPQCWDGLLVSEYLQIWWTANGDDCDQYFADLGFAACYQSKVGRGAFSGQRCDLISAGSCTGPQNLSDYQLQDDYVLTSIFGIWQWFSNVNEAIVAAQSTASERIGVITTTIDPETPQSTLSQVFDILTIVVSALSLPGSVLESTGAHLLEDALLQAPLAASALSDQGTLDSQVDQTYSIDNSLSQVVPVFRQNVANALSILQSNFTEFMTFAAHGSFVVGNSSVTALATNLTTSLTTFVVSQSLHANSYQVIFTPDTNPYAMRHNGSLPTKYNNNVNCQDPPDQYGVCSNWFYDGSDSYSLSVFPSDTQNHYALMETIFSNGWTTGEALFVGAKNCAVSSIAQNGNETSSAISSFTIPETLGAQCISNLTVNMYPFDTSCFWIGQEGFFASPHDYGHTGCLYIPIYISNPNVTTTLQRKNIRQYGPLLNSYLESLGI